MPGVWPSSKAVVIYETKVTTLIPPLGGGELGVYGLFTLDPPPAGHL